MSIYLIGEKGKNKKLVQKLIRIFSENNLSLQQILLDSDESLHKQLDQCKQQIKSRESLIITLNPEHDKNLRIITANIGNNRNIKVIYCRKRVIKNSEEDVAEQNHLRQINGVHVFNMEETVPLHSRIINFIMQGSALAATN